MIIFYILLIAFAAYGAYKLIDKYVDAEKLNKIEDRVDKNIYKVKRGKKIMDKQRELRAAKKDLRHAEEISALEKEIEALKEGGAHES